MNEELSMKNEKTTVSLLLVLVGAFIWAFTPVSDLSIVADTHAQDTATVSATVQVQNIAISVSDGAVDYGTLTASSSEDTINLTDTQTATNEGNVAENFNIQGQDATGTGSNDWTLSENETGNDKYVHRFSTNSGTDWTPMSSTTYKTLATNVASTSQQTFDLEIQTPQSSTDTDQKNADVTVQAVAN